MAKGLRSSVKKSNRSKLRTRVFAPVEDARLERLHAKLMEAVQQPKPDVPAKKEMDIDTAEELKNDDMPKGSCILTAKIPGFLSSTTTNTTITPPEDEESLFFLNLGLCSDIVGFNENGDLAYMEIDDGAAADSTTRSSSKAPKKKINKSKLKIKRKPRNSIAFPKSGKGGLKPFAATKVNKRR